MILHSIRLEHWRSLLGPVEVGPFVERINIVHAPNGIGKSSLFEAMRRTLFDAHNVTGREIEAVRPWGRALSPKVNLEFSQSGVRYRVEKSFLDGASAKLFRYENGSPLPIAESKNADARLREILSVIDAPGRGLSKQEHWGLAQALWATQGATYPDALTPSVTDHIRTALGAQLAGASSTQLELLLEEKYLEFYTKGGKARTGKQAAPLVALEDELAALGRERSEWAQKNQRYLECVRRVEDARQTRSQIRNQTGALQEALRQTRLHADDYAQLTAELHRRRQIEQSARERHDALSQTLHLIQKTKEELASLDTQLTASDALVKELGPELESAKAIAAECRQKRDEARSRRGELDSQGAKIEDARAYLKEQQELEACEAKVTKIAALLDGLANLKKRRAATVAPDDKTLRAIRKAISERDTAQSALKASLIHLTITPEHDTSVRSKETGKAQKLRATKVAEFSGSPHVEIEVQGFGVIRASGPEGDAEEHRENFEAAKRSLEKLTLPYGTTNLEDLENLHAAAVDIDRKIETQEEQCSLFLGKSSFEDLEASRAELKAKIDERLSRNPAWRKSAPNVHALKEAADEVASAIKHAVASTEEAHEAAESRAQGTEKRLTEATAANKNLRKNLQAASSRLADLTRDGISEAERAASRQSLVLEWEAAKLAADNAEAALKKYPDDPSKAVAKQERQMASLADTEAKSRDMETAANAELGLLIAEGAYSRLAEIEEKKSALEVRRKRELLRMASVQLLYDTVAACKNAAIAAVAAPVEAAATRLFARVAGPRLGAIQLSGSFAPVGIRPEVATETVEISNLSAGEQEQLFLIIRLALGQVLAKSERQLVVLDDVLNATDMGRFARMNEVLHESTDRLQIVIFTCHPENYRGIEGAVFHDLRGTGAS